MSIVGVFRNSCISIFVIAFWFLKVESTTGQFHLTIVHALGMDLEILLFLNAPFLRVLIILLLYVLKKFGW